MNCICNGGEKKEFDTESIKLVVGGVTIHIQGKNNDVIIGTDCKLINVTINIIGENNKVCIGNKCVLSNCKILLSAPAKCRNVKIGDKCYIGGALLVLPSNDNLLEIGEDCMFSNEIVLRTEDGHPIFDLETKELCNKGGHIRIGKHCWIGERAYILKDVCLEDDTIVGACSLVTKKFKEKNIVIAGIPAKIVKRNVGWNKQYIQDYK